MYNKGPGEVNIFFYPLLDDKILEFWSKLKQTADDIFKYISNEK